MPVVNMAIPLATFLLLTAVGLDLTAADFASVRRQPRIVAIGLFAPLLVLPVVALALVGVSGAPRSLATGLLLIAACPIGGISNTYSYLARAATALSVSLTGLSCLLAGLTIPLLTRLFQSVLGWPLGFDAPLGLLVLQVVVALVLPVCLGMGIRRLWPGFARRRRGAVRRAAFVVLTLLIVLIVLTHVDEFLNGLARTVPLAAAFISVSFAVGWASAVAGRAGRRERFTLAAEFATRNVAVATTIAVTLLRRSDFAVLAVTYFITEIPLMLLAIGVFRLSFGVSTPPTIDV